MDDVRLSPECSSILIAYSNIITSHLAETATYFLYTFHHEVLLKRNVVSNYFLNFSSEFAVNICCNVGMRWSGGRGGRSLRGRSRISWRFFEIRRWWRKSLWNVNIYGEISLLCFLCFLFQYTIRLKIKWIGLEGSGRVCMQMGYKLRVVVHIP